MSNVDGLLFVFTADSTSEQCTSVRTFNKLTKEVSFFNFTMGLKNVQVVDYFKDIYLSASSLDDRAVYIFQSTDTRLALFSQLRLVTRILEANDVCPRLVGLYVQTTPRVRYLSQCAVGQEYVVEEEIVARPNNVAETFHYSLTWDMPALTSTVGGCLLGNFFVYGSNAD